MSLLLVIALLHANVAWNFWKRGVNDPTLPVPLWIHALASIAWELVALWLLLEWLIRITLDVLQPEVHR